MNLCGFPDNDFPCVVVGNKLDLVSTAHGDPSLREITLEMLQDWANTVRPSTSNMMTVIEASAKTKEGIDDTFKAAVFLFCNRYVLSIL